MWKGFCGAAKISQQEADAVVLESSQIHDDIPHSFGYLIMTEAFRLPSFHEVDLWYPLLDWNLDYVGEKFIYMYLKEKTHAFWIPDYNTWYTRANAVHESQQDLQSEIGNWVYIAGNANILYHLEKLREVCQEKQAFRLLSLVNMYLNTDMCNSDHWKAMQRKNMLTDPIVNRYYEDKYYLTTNDNGTVSFISDSDALKRIVVQD
jgi:hypothetical protein